MRVRRTKPARRRSRAGIIPWAAANAGCRSPPRAWRCRSGWGWWRQVRRRRGSRPRASSCGQWRCCAERVRRRYRRVMALHASAASLFAHPGACRGSALRSHKARQSAARGSARSARLWPRRCVQEPAPHVRPAGSFGMAPWRAVEVTKAAVTVGLQHALESARWACGRLLCRSGVGRKADDRTRSRQGPARRDACARRGDLVQCRGNSIAIMRLRTDASIRESFRVPWRILRTSRIRAPPRSSHRRRRI